MLSLKKRKQRKKTRRKIKKGGRGVRVNYIPIHKLDGQNKLELLYPIIEDIPLNKAYGKGKYVKNTDGNNIIPYFSESVSLTDFVPILDNGEEQFVFDMFSGKPPNQLVKQSTIYVHSRRDLQMIELYDFIHNNYETKNDLLEKLVKLLETNRNDPKKLKNMVTAMKKYIDELAAAAAPAAAATAFKTQFELPDDIGLTMYESKILDKLYQEIDDDSVKSIMILINGYREAPLHKFKLIYSKNDNNTYNNIRYVIITLMLNTDIRKDYAAAANPAAAAGPGGLGGPAAAPVQGNNNNQIPALIAAIAAANAPGLAPGLAPGPAPGDPLQARALIAAIVAALARPVP